MNRKRTERERIKAPELYYHKVSVHNLCHQYFFPMRTYHVETRHCLVIVWSSPKWACVREFPWNFQIPNFLAAICFRFFFLLVDLPSSTAFHLASMRRSSRSNKISTVNDSGPALDKGGPSEEEKLANLTQELVDLVEDLPRSDERIGRSEAFEHGRKLAGILVRCSHFLALACILIWWL